MLRLDGSDRQVWADTFTGLYHLPPPEMAVPSTVLDLGANIGLTAAHYRALWPDAQIVAVEMDEENAAIARLNFPGSVLRYAVGGHSGWRVYSNAPRAEAYAVGEPLPTYVYLTEGESRVMGSRLYDLLAVFDDRQCDFVKMDVEGAEWEVFGDDQWVPFVRHLLVELHGDGDSVALVERAVSALRHLGFEARHHPPHPQAVYAWR